MNDLRVGDIITIPRDQYGRPVRRFDPETRLPTTELQRFVVTEVGADVTLRVANDGWPSLRRAFYKRSIGG